MATRLARPHQLDPQSATDPCRTCDARAISVCNAVPDADIARLASIAVVTEVTAGPRLHRRGRTGQLLLQRHRRHRQAVQTAARRAAADHRLRRPRPFPGPRGLRYLRVQRRGDRAGALLPVPAGRAAPFAGRLPADGEAPAGGCRQRTGRGAGADAAARAQDGARAPGLLPADAEPTGTAVRPCAAAVQAADDAQRYRRLSRADHRDSEPDPDATSVGGRDRDRLAERIG